MGGQVFFRCLGPMRQVYRASLLSAIAAVYCPAPVLALDAQPAPPVAAIAPLPMFKDPRSALREGVETLQRGDAVNSVPALRYAADGGELLAQWRLGRMHLARA